MPMYPSGLGRLRDLLRRGTAPLGVTSVTRNGITMTLAAPAQAGTYANGEYWVLGPVSVTAFDPPSRVQASGQYSDAVAYTNRTIHGVQVNPGNRSFVGGTTAANSYGEDRQGYDSLTVDSTGNPDFPWQSNRNVDPGITGSALAVTTGTIVKAVSRDGQGGRSAPPADGRQFIHRMEAFTVVSAAPPAGAFRPPVASSDKTSSFTLSDMDSSWLPSLALPSGAPTPDIAALTAVLKGPYPLQYTQNTGHRMIMPVNDTQQEYGRDIGHDVSIAALALCLNIYTSAEKRALLASICQLGLDVYGRLKEGGIFPGNGGGEPWRKLALCIAARAFQGAAAGADLATGAGRKASFAEGSQYFTIAKSDVDGARYRADGRPRVPYNLSLVGTPEWGEQHIINPNRDGANWSAFYRSVNHSHMLAQAIAVRLLGLATIWNDAICLDYYDRTWARTKTGTFQSISLRHGAVPTANDPSTLTQRMWEVYRADTDTAAPSRVELAAKDNLLWVRTDKLLDSASIPLRTDFALTVNGSSVAIPADVVTTITTTAGSDAATVPAGLTLYPGMVVVSANVADGTRVKAQNGTSVTLDTVAGATGAAASCTFKSFEVRGRGCSIALPQTLLNTNTLTLAYTVGANPIRSIQGTNLPGFTATAVTNRTGELVAPAPSIALVPNNSTTPLAVSRIAGGLGTETGITRFLIAMRFRADALAAGAPLLWFSNNCRLYMSTAAQLRLQWVSSSRFVQSITLNATGTYTFLAALDFTQTGGAAGGRMYLNNTAAAAPSTFVQGSPIDLVSLGTTLRLFGDGASANFSGAFGYLWMHWGDSSFTLPDITQQSVRDTFATLDGPGGNGEVPLGFAPKVFLPGYQPEMDEAGLENRGTLGSLEAVKTQGVWA